MAKTSASSLNWNSVSFYIRPSKKLKQPAKVFISPENQFIQTINKIKTGKKTDIRIKRISSSKKKEVFQLTGSINLNEKEVVRYRNVSQPAFWMGWNILSFLSQRGIKISGTVKKGVCQGFCVKLAEWESRPLPFHSYNMMKFSNNFVSRMLITHLPLLDHSKKGDLKKGVSKLNLYLKNEEKLKNFTLVEPSGLSRKNRFSPKQLKKILIHSLEKPYVYEMLSSYPLSGGVGTLNTRFLNLPPDFYVRAKTGSLHGVLSLAGLTGSKKTADKYGFVFIFNGNPKHIQKSQELFDEMILLILQK